ncbi:hypothetical protein B0H10DRAFT_2196179 [Mycena sp. CBHHK59/15]|nr:hypothetical protein B0H10DRAFT_2196179 [Mycena sp. CBHHK59/15]
MFFSYALTAAALIHATAAAAVVLPRVTPTSGDCIHFGKYIGIHDNTGASSYFQGALMSTAPASGATRSAPRARPARGCGRHVYQAETELTFLQTTGVVTLAQCQNNNVVAAGSIPNLDYNIYAKIVGDCAWAKGGCPITQQNFIDFVYGQMSAAGTTSWPNVADVVAQWWNPIVAWTATGDSIPYTNFNDWLHWSNS